MTGCRSIALLYALCFAPACMAGLFENQEQQAEKLFKQNKFEAAAETFTDSYRRGVAQYRAGQYGQAAETFDRVRRESVKSDALYNLGNSRFQEGKLEAAAEAYRQVLLREPDYEDARHNLGLTSAMLAETSEEEKLNPRDEDERKQQDEEEQKEQGEQQQKEQEQQEEQEKKEQQSGDEQSEQQESSGDQEQQEQQSSSDKQSDEQQQSGDEQSEQQESSGDQEQQEQQSSSGKQSDEQQQSGDEQSEQQESSGDQEQQEQQSSALKESDQQQDGDDGELEKQDVTGNDRADQQSGGSEHATEDGQSGRDDYEQASDQSGDGMETEGSSGNEHLDDADAATADSGDRDHEAGGNTAGLRQQAGVANDPRDFDPARANMNMGAIEQFDQLGKQVDSEGDNAVLPGEIPGASGNSTVTLMEQLLDQVEGDPVSLMRNQFRLEEQRMNRTGGQLYEPRPW